MPQFIPGENEDMVQDNGEVCPGCGQSLDDQPYRREPTPINSEMMLRNVPLPGELSEDSGGNPLDEGIAAEADNGWRNRMKRDESFASVRTSNDGFIQGVPGFYPEGYPKVDLPPDPNQLSEEAKHRIYQPVCPDCGQPLVQQDELRDEPGGKFEKSDEATSDGHFPANDHLATWFEDRTKIYAPLGYDSTHLANDPQIEQIQTIEPGPHTVEVDTGEDNPIVLQHDNPELLDEAKQKLEAKVAGPLLALVPEGVAALFAGGAEAGAAGAGAAAADAGAAGAAGAAEGGAAAAGTAAADGASAASGTAEADMGAAAGAEGSTVPAAEGAAGGGVTGTAKNLSDKWKTISNLMNHATGGQQQQPANAVATPEPFLSSLHSQLVAANDDYDRPGSDDELVEREDKPHDVDPHEFEDGEDKGLYDRDDNEVGGSQNPRHKRDQSQDNHPENEHADDEQNLNLPEMSDGLLSQIQSLLPLLFHHAQGGTGADDPMIQDLHNNLEAANPGYRNLDPGIEHIQMIISPGHGMEKESEPEHEPKKSTVTPAELYGQQQTPAPPVSTPMQQPQMPGACPSCGSQLAGGRCPNCGHQAKIAGPMPPGAVGPPGGMPMAPPPPPPPPGSAGQQGPHTRQQLAAVAAYLQATGRGKEIISMLENPQNYSEELSKIQKRDAPPELEDAGQNPVPAQEEAPPGDTMPMPNPADQDQSQMLSSRFKVAVDTVAPVCPNCGSHSTGSLDDNGKCGCKTCGHEWQADHKLVTDEARVSAELHNEQGVPAAEQEHQPDPMAEQDPSHTWVDQNGDPLQVGRQYQMFSAQYDIPDIVTITSVKPNGIKYEITGEYGLAHQTEVTKEEADLDALSFTPLDHGESLGDDFSPETNNDNQGVDEVTQSDLSTPHQQFYSNYADYEQLAALRRECPADINRQVDGILTHQGVGAAINYLQEMGVSAPQAQDADPRYWDSLQGGGWNERAAAGIGELGAGDIGKGIADVAQNPGGHNIQLPQTQTPGWDKPAMPGADYHNALHNLAVQQGQGANLNNQFNPQYHTWDNYKTIGQQYGVSPQQVQQGLQQFYQGQYQANPGAYKGPSAVEKADTYAPVTGVGAGQAAGGGAGNINYQQKAPTSTGEYYPWRSMPSTQNPQQYYAPTSEAPSWNTGVQQITQGEGATPGAMGVENMMTAEQQAINQQKQLIQQQQQQNQVQQNVQSVPGMMPTSRVAGQHYTQSEQNELINEPGMARNADKLDLSNTHYEEEALDQAVFW